MYTLTHVTWYEYGNITSRKQFLIPWMVYQHNSRLVMRKSLVGSYNPCLFILNGNKCLHDWNWTMVAWLELPFVLLYNITGDCHVQTSPALFNHTAIHSQLNHQWYVDAGGVIHKCNLYVYFASPILLLCFEVIRFFIFML